MIAKVLNIIRATRDGRKTTQVEVDPGGGANVTADLFQSAGDDSAPLRGDLVAIVGVAGSGRKIAVNMADIKHDDVSDYGEKRLYSRDSAGDVKAIIFIKNDGTVSITNDNGSLEMAPDGAVNINGAVIDKDGNITAGEISAKTSLKVFNKEVNLHTHEVTSAPGTTGPFL